MSYYKRGVGEISTNEAITIVGTESGKLPRAMIPTMPGWMLVGIVAVAGYALAKGRGR